MGYTYLEDSVLPEDDGHGSASAETSRLSRGSFLLRRAHYFNGIWHEKLISHNLRLALVDHIAQQYINRGVALSDLIKEGNLGLARALENFELEGGSRFSSYAARCIRQNIERAIMSQPEAGRFPGISKIAPPLVAGSFHSPSVSSRGAKPHHQALNRFGS